MPGFVDIIANSSSAILGFTFLMGLLWGVGGLSYGLGVRYLGMSLGNTNGGVTELYINDEKIGKRWFGKAIYPVADYLNEGENKIEIKYTTVLANYCKSLNNPLTNRWTRNYKDLVATGLEGPVELLSY
ncbi:MAG: hypothetical protein ABF286_06050 [Polaribacter sp.]